MIMLVVGAPRTDVDVVVVCPDSFQKALAPWLEHRSAQGHSIAVISNTDSAHGIRQRIRRMAQSGPLRFVVLVGDVEVGYDRDPVLRARCVPVHHARAKVNVLWGSEPHIATDNYYADLDDDLIPELAVGRLTADTPDELRRIVTKILAYERSDDFGPWRRRVNVVAGIGGFGPLVDMALEASTKYFLTQRIPTDYQVNMTYGSWRSPYCPDPRLFHATTLKRLNEGSWFWVYIGHGYPLGLDRVIVPGGHYHILANPDVEKLQCRHGAPIALFLACYTGAFDASVDCLGERMLREPGGPVAVIASSRVAMPYAMSLLAGGMIDQCFVHRRETLGEAILHAKRQMMQPADESDRQRVAIDRIAAAISPDPKRLTDERAEHLLLFNLIGDPMLRLKYPREIQLEVPKEVRSGTLVEIRGVCPIEGRGTVELAVDRRRLTFRPPPRDEYPQTDEALAEFQQTYEQANDRRLCMMEVAVKNGQFTAQLEVPAAARGKCRVCMFVAGKDGFAMGASEVKIVATDARQADRRAQKSPEPVPATRGN